MNLFKEVILRGQVKKIILIKIFTLMLFLLFFGQYCSKVNLEENKQFSFKLSDNPYHLKPPNSFPAIRRFVFFMDMSHSMISGLCIQDIEGDKNYAKQTFDVYDPNKGVGNLNDHRPSGVDCKVDPNRAFNEIIDSKPIDLTFNPSVFLLTHPGIDYDKDRFTVLKSWIQKLRNDIMKEGDSTQVMIVPFSGGQSQILLTNNAKVFLGEKGFFQFIDIASPTLDTFIQWMEEEHDFNYELAKSDDAWRYEKKRMGTSAPGALYKNLYDALADDMRVLNNNGLLFYSDYQWIHVTDGFLTPIKEHMEYVLSSYAPCANCALNPDKCIGVCSTLVTKMRSSWGDPKDQELNQLDFYFGLIESLPSYFGSGNVKLDFVSLQPTRTAMARPGEKPFWDSLTPYFKKRGAKPIVWNLENGKSDLKLNSTNNGLVNYRGTHFYIFSPNVKVNTQGIMEPDSDNDGLSDNEERLLGTDPLNPRTNQYCLDSFLTSAAFGERCRAFASSRSCDNFLDSDGDSLNECEESLLGTKNTDFDTDGDSFPDFYEWIYGYNPLINDYANDTLGDGVQNSTKFSAGLPPNAVYNSINKINLVQYAINGMGNDLLRDEFNKEHWVDLKQIILLNFPVTQGEVAIQNQGLLSVSRVGKSDLSMSANAIHFEDQLLSPIARANSNTLVALVRLVDVDEPSKIYWQIYKVPVPVPIEIMQPQMDLSQFKLIRTRDQGGAGGE